MMHPARRQILLRWAVYLLALLSPLVWWWTAAGALVPAVAPPQAPDLGLPALADEQVVARCVATLERVRREQAAGRLPGPVRASLRLLREPRGRALDFDDLNLEQILAYKWQKTERLPHLSLVFFSGTNRMAVIDGKVVRQGSRLWDGSRVLRIERNAVVLGGRGRIRRIPWHDPRQVRLSRSGS